MKKWIIAIFILFLVFIGFNFVFTFPTFAEQKAEDFTQKENPEINLFFGNVCPHCATEENFLRGLKKEYPGIKINKFEISEGKNIDLLRNLYRDYKVPSNLYGLIPATFIKDRYFIGFNEKIGEGIEGCVKEALENGLDKPCSAKQEFQRGSVTPANLEKGINVPFIGEVDIGRYSLPFLAVILGILDGFNVCSLGALVLILGLVLALGSRKKILIFGGLYILISSLVYGFLIILWYQVFSFFIPYMKTMKLLIGLLGIGGGIFFLREFIKFKKRGAVCESGTGEKLFSRFSSKFQKTLKESGNIFLLIGGVVLFAGIIAIVEFPCSAAVPVVFAGLLAQSQLPTFYYLLYIIAYLVFYTLDEIIVFLVALFTMKVWLASNKTMIWITLSESIILFILGIYYLFGFSAFL